MNIILQIILAFLLADFITGIFHWIEDTYLDYCIDIPFISDIAKDNDMHHYFPRSIVAYSYWENTRVNLILGVIMLVVIYAVNKNFFVNNICFVLIFTFFAVISNVCHRFSHMRDCENSQTVIFLQKIGILSSHTYHSVHHETSLTRYCPISVYNNYILDSIYFWRILECIVFLLTGITPSRNQYNKYKSIHNHMHENAKLECPKKPTKEDIDELKLLLEKYRKCNTNS